MRSKIFLPILFLITCINLSAQIKKGTFLVGGNLSLGGTVNKEKTFLVNSTSYLGCFVKDK